MAKPRVDDPLTAEQLRAVLDYYPSTGVFRWRSRPDIRPSVNSLRNGRQAGTVAKHGYIHICINARMHLAHRLAWLYVHGRLPAHEIDHINEDRSDNRIANLREASHGQNNTRAKARADNKSGVLGVFRCGRKWQAQIMHEGAKYHLGVWDTIEEAKTARDKAAEFLHGAFARLK